MIRILILVLLVNGGCSLSTANKVGVVSAIGSIAVDGWQTLYVERTGYACALEGGMLGVFSGPRPSRTAIFTYQASVSALIGLAYTVLPERWRPALWGSVLGVQSYVIYNNAHTMTMTCEGR